MNIGLGSPNELETQNHLEPVLSPNDKTEIAISTALTISVFKLTILPNLTQRKSSLTSPSPFLSLVSERNTHSHLVDPSAEAICIAWKPDRKYRYIFAVGFNNATVILLNLSPNQRDNPHYINSVYAGGGNRTCSSLVWNPVEPQLLAIGFTKVSRPDQSLRIWDVTCSPDQISGGLGSVFPGITTGHVTSLCWVPNSDQSLAYSNKSGVGVYDYNKRKLRGRPNRSKAIHGLCTDSLSRLYVASFYDLRVRVWGIGDLTQPLLCLDTAHPIVSIVWSTLRARTLLVLTSYPHVYLLPLPSVPHAGTEKEGQENTDWLCNLICEPLHSIHAAYPSSRFSFLPHPTSRGSFLLLQFPAPSPQALRLHPTIEELPLPAFTSISVSPRDCLVSASDLQLALAAVPMESSSGGTMRRYVEAGYCFDPKRNLEVCREQGGLGLALARLWEWVVSVEKGLEGSAARSQVCDVMLNGLAKSVLREARIDKTQSDCCDVSPDSGGRRRAMPCWQQFPSRELCLRLLGWFPPVEGGEEGVGKTALCSLLSSPQLGPKKAIQALQSAGTGSSTGEVGAVVMALAGYSSSHLDNFWVDTCLSQTETLTDPYLRLCVSLLYSDYDAVPRTIEQERISSNDKFALACAYLRDRDLDKFGSDLLKEIQDQSLLEGLFLTGLGELGILVMKNFLSRGGDLLTVSILSSFTLRYSLEIGTSLSRDASEHIQAWWNSLCDFLDKCRLWKERCRLEIERGRLLDHKSPDSLFKWHVLCGFCGKQIAGGDRKDLRGRRHGSTHPTPEKCSGSCCPACFKPLPRCVVCHRHMGSSADHVPSGTSAPTDDWMTWCQTCCHWGHSKHISDWFRENSICPAPGCSCLCLVNNQLLS